LHRRTRVDAGLLGPAHDFTHDHLYRAALRVVVRGHHFFRIGGQQQERAVVPPCRVRAIALCLVSLTAVRKLLVGLFALALAGCASAQPLAVDLSPSAERGLTLSQQSGCASCHGSDFGGGTGPTWQGIIGQQVAFKGGESGVVDRAYLVESIKYPDKKKRVGYSVIMPYNNLTDAEILDIVDYIEALSK
jgi:cytochrome c553